MDNSDSQNNNKKLNRTKEYFKLDENEREIDEQFKRAESNFTENVYQMNQPFLKELIELNIYISYDNEFKSTTIDLNNNKRYMKSFKDIGFDITIVEISKEDNISKVFYLNPEVEIMLNNELINNKIYILQYPIDKELMNAKGKIKEINIIKDDIRKKRNNIKYNLEKENPNKEELKKNTADKKSIKCYQNCKSLFICLVAIGVLTAFAFKFIYDKKEKNVRFNFDNGEYYIGQSKNGLRHGKGTEYYSNGKIKYKGDWINDKFVSSRNIFSTIYNYFL